MADEGRQSYSIHLDNSALRRGARESVSILHGIGTAAQREGDVIDSSFSKIGAAAAGIFAAAKLKDYAVQVAKVRGEFQQLEIAFTTMLGSAEKGDALMTQLIHTAATTPFGMSDITKSAKQLLAYGVEADKVNETLIRLGDIAAGLSIPIGDLAYLYGTTMTQGRLYTQDLRQFMGRGIPLADELAKQFGVTKDKVGELVTEGKVGFPEVERAIVAMTSAGSKFGGLMAAQSKTITGQISNIEDSIEQMFNTLGKQSEGVINNTLDVVSSVVENWEKIGKVLLTVISAYGAYKAAVIAVAAAHKVAAIWSSAQAFLSLTKSVTSAKDAMLLFNMVSKANPLGLVLSVLATAATAFALFADKTDTARDKMNALNDRIADQEKQLQDLENQERAMSKVEEDVARSTAERISKIDLLRQRTEDATLSIDNRRKAIKELHAIVPKYNATIDKEGQLHVKNANAIDQEVAAMTRLAYAKAMQSKREELVASQLAADLKRSASQRDVDKAAAEVASTTQAYNRAQAQAQAVNERNRQARGGAGFAESAVADVAAGQTTQQAVQTALNAKRAAELQLQVSQNELKIAQKQYDISTSDIATLDAYAKEHKLDLAKDYTTKTVAGLTDSEAQKLSDAAAARSEKIAQYAEDEKQQRVQAQLDIRQAEISAMDEGTDKELAQVALNYDRLIAENNKRRTEMLEALKDEKTREWLQANPQATKEQQIGYRTSLQLSESDLSANQQATLKEYTRVANDIRMQGNREALTEMLADVLSYEQKRAAIEKEYADKHDNLYDENGNLREGATQDNIVELGRKRAEALQAVDEEFAAREEQYNVWCNKIATMSLQQLEDVLQKAQNELSQLEGSEASSENDLAVARAKVAKATEAIRKANVDDNTNPGKRSAQEWKDLYEVLSQCTTEFKTMGDQVGGTAGEIVSATGQIMSSTLTMINGIVQLVNSSSAGMTATATAASAAIKTVESASVILTIISAALQAATLIANTFNNDDDLDEANEKLTARIENLQWLLDNAEAVRLANNTEDAVNRVNKALATTREELARANNNGMYIASWWSKASIYTGVMTSAVKKLAIEYSNLKYTADKALGESRYSDFAEQLENYSQQQIVLQEQIDNEQAQKHTSAKAIQEYEQKIAEITEEAVSLINDAVEEIIGGSAQDIANELADAFVDAFQAGEDAAAAWGDKVNEIVADVMKRMLVQSYLEERLGEVFDKYKEKWFENGNWVGTEAVIASMSGFASDLQSVGDEFAAIWDALPDAVKNTFTSTAERAATSSGIATASQESVDELNGRMTAVQSHTFSISENTKVLVSNTQAILNAVLSIDTTTQALEERMQIVETYTKSVRDTLNDISLKGVKLK